MMDTRMMDTKKRARLEAAGWTVGSADEFLELSPEESAFVEVKLALSSGLKEIRAEQGLTQGELAERLGSSQSRVAKMEASDPSVSLDLLVRGLLAAGATKKDIAAVITRRVPKRSRSRSARSNTA
jgi:DNA-binding transcriptional regulator YiaG